jgi:hypothetical protein
MSDENEGTDSEVDKRSVYCIECSLEKGYARYREEKGERVLTFFPGEPDEIQLDQD